MYYIIRYDAELGERVTYAYRSVKDARKALYTTLSSKKHLVTMGMIYEYRDNDPRHGKLIGKGYVSPFDRDLRKTAFLQVDKDTRYYINYVNHNTSASKPSVYDLNPDGTLGRRH